MDGPSGKIKVINGFSIGKGNGVAQIIVDFTQLGGGKHICPYGCGRMIPDQYHGCSELLRDCPNYVFWIWANLEKKWSINYIFV